MRGRQPSRAACRAVSAPLVVVALMVGLALWGPAHRGPAQAPVLPAGWQQVPQAGKLLSLAVVDDVVWAGSRDGLGRLDRRTGRWLGSVDLGRPATFVRALLPDGQGHLWIGCLQGLFRWDPLTVVDHTAALPAPRVNALLLDHAGRLWIGTADGLAVMANGQPRLAPESALLPSPIVNALAEDGQGGLWVGNTSSPAGGLTRIAGGRAQVWRVRDGLPHSYVNGLCRASAEGCRGGLVWAACGQGEYGGVGGVWDGGGGWAMGRRLSRADGLAGAKARSVLVDRDGDLWVGSENDGLTVVPVGAPVRRFGVADGLSHVEVTAMAEDVDGTLWLATLGGLTRLSRAAVLAAKGR